MFDLSEYPQPVRDAFHSSAAFWPVAVSEAMKSGTSHPDKLTDLIFFMHHPERMRGDIGKPLSEDERNFNRLAEEWQGFRSVVIQMMAPITPSTPEEEDWDLSDTARRGLKRLGGEALVDWAEIPPADGAEAMVFSSPRKDLKGVIAWKSKDPRSDCFANPRERVQLYLMLPERLDYWEERMPNTRQARIVAETNKTSNRIYREHIVERKLCPKAARNLEQETGKTLILMMAGGLFGMMPIPGVGDGGSASFKSLKKLIEAAGSLLEEAR